MTFDQKLQAWIVLETSLFSEGSLKNIPSLSTLSRLTTGKNKRVWNYIIQHIRSRHATEKVKRILEIKRYKNEHDKHSKTNTCSKNINFLRREITILNEKCEFLKTSMSSTKDKILTTKCTVRELRNDIDKICQRTAFLEMLTLKYNEKNIKLNSLQNQVSFYLLNRFANEKVNKIPLSVILIHKGKDNLGLDYILSQVLSVVMKKLRDSEDFVISKELVIKRIDQILKFVSLSDLIFHLKDQSQASYNIVLKNMVSTVESELTCEEKWPLSQKQLQNMKISHIASIFSAGKTKKEIEYLVKEKDALFKTKIKSMESLTDVYIPKKQELFKLMLENEALDASIKYFEETLCKINKDNQTLHDKNKRHVLAIQDVENLMINFYKDFDLLKNLLHSVSSTHHEIVTFLSFLHSYGNEQVFLAITPDLQKYSNEMEKELQLRLGMFWSTCEQDNIMQPFIRDLDLRDPDTVWDATNLSLFYNISMIARQVKHVKEMLREHEEDEFQFKCEGVTSVEHQYNKMMDILSKMLAYLQSSNDNFELCSVVHNNLQIAVKDWWEQGAQYIHKILCDDKTLKMWQDILIYLSDF